MQARDLFFHLIDFVGASLSILAFPLSTIPTFVLPLGLIFDSVAPVLSRLRETARLRIPTARNRKNKPRL
ncbi:MAG: hypothetical protein ACRD3W_18550, partial [Terriglobales bacterium]